MLSSLQAVAATSAMTALTGVGTVGVKIDKSKTVFFIKSPCCCTPLISKLNIHTMITIKRIRLPVKPPFFPRRLSAAFWRHEVRHKTRRLAPRAAQHRLPQGPTDLAAADTDQTSNPTIKSRRITIDIKRPTCCMRRARVPAGEDLMLSSLQAVAAASSSSALGSLALAAPDTDRTSMPTTKKSSSINVFPCSAWKAWFHPLALISSQVLCLRMGFLGQAFARPLC